MIMDNPNEAAAQLKTGQRLLGLDLGSKTIGLALSDPGLCIASPYATIRRRGLKQDAEALKTVIVREGVGGLILGLPRNMNGSEGPAAQSARKFADDIAGLFPGLVISFWDERLSTVAVTRTLLEADASRKRRAELVDKLAAAYFLQGALDALRLRPANLAG